MRVTSLIISTLLAVTSALPLSTIVKRDAASIVKALEDIQKNVQTLNSTVNSFTEGSFDGAFKALQIQQQSSAVSTSVDAAINGTNASDTLTSDEGTTVSTAVLSLKADLATFLPNLSSKKPAFDKIFGFVSVSQTVLKTLQEQKDKSKTLGDAIIAKLPAGPLVDAAPAVQQSIADAFDMAIEVFKQPGGSFALPPIPGGMGMGMGG